MRIALALAWYFPESLGGTEVYVESLAAHLKASGCDVRIVAPLAGLETPREYEHNGQRVFRYPVPREATRHEARGDTAARGAEAFAAWLRRIDPDILHIHSLVTGLGLHEIQAAHDMGVPVVLTNHLPSLGFICLRGSLLRWGEEACDGRQHPRSCAACLLQQRGIPKPLTRVAAAVEPLWLARAASQWPGRLATGLALPALVERAAARQRRLLELVERFVVLSDWARSIVQANGAPADKIVVNKLGISHSQVPVKPGPDAIPTRPPVTIGYVGRYDWTKGLREFAVAVRSVPADTLRFEFVGPADSAAARHVRQHLENAIGADPRVRFRPPVAPHEVPAVLSQFDVLCCPSTWFENGPTIALEAQAVGTPVIGTRLGAFEENVADGLAGCLVPPADSTSLAHVFQSIADNPSVIDRWRRGLKPVRTMRMCADDYLQLYPQLLRESAVGL
jgi:glycosyltransferase involved in cell wall biosynthesis